MQMPLRGQFMEVASLAILVEPLKAFPFSRILVLLSSIEISGESLVVRVTRQLEIVVSVVFFNTKPEPQSLRFSPLSVNPLQRSRINAPSLVANL
jgi:hypothetical protein